MIDSLSIAVHAFVRHVSMSFSVDETLAQSELLKNKFPNESTLHDRLYDI